MNILISNITKQCCRKQLFIATHSSFVMNKSGLNKVIFLHKDENKKIKSACMANLDKSTFDFFKRLPGYDTLRMIIAKKSILVEGPSDELIVQKAYFNLYGKLPIEDGIDVISVRALAFKRFLDVAKLLNKNVIAITDNDGNTESVKKKYEGYLPYIEYSSDINKATLESHLVADNELKLLNLILNTTYNSKQELEKYMLNPTNKTNNALKIFETSENINLPEYIINALKK